MKLQGKKVILRSPKLLGLWKKKVISQAPNTNGRLVIYDRELTTRHLFPDSVEYK